MPSVNQATQIFSILSDLVLAEYLAKHDTCFPLNDDLQRVIAKAGLRYQIFLSRMRDYAGLDDALMERYTMVPWLSQQPIDIGYCEGFFSLALSESGYGSYERGELRVVANKVLSILWPRLVQALAVARFDCLGEKPSPSYGDLADVLKELNVVLEAGQESVAHRAAEMLTNWWSQRIELSSDMILSEQDSFLNWTTSEARFWE